MKRFLWLGIVLGLALTTAHFALSQAPADSDEITLKSHKLPTDTEGLLKFFRKRSLKEGDAKHLQALVRKLGSNVYREREPAAKEIVAYGSAAIPFLKTALVNTPLETKRRAELCIKEIDDTSQTEPVSAAARRLAKSSDPAAALVLLNFVPSVSNDPALEEEVLACIGRLTVRPGKIDPLILTAVKDPSPDRRSVAAYLLGRRGGPDYRAQLRTLLDDPDLNVRLRVAQGLFGKRPAQMVDEALAGDQKLLRDAKIDPTEPALLKYFADKTLSEARQQHFRGLIQSMGTNTYLIRERATKQLIKEGPSVLAFLREAEFDTNVERARRARDCLEEIRRHSNDALPIAAAHLLARPATSKEQSPAAAIRALLAYIPFADDEAVEEEILTCLTLLCLREAKIEPELIQALSDPSTARRGAAAYVLGHVGVKEQIAKLPPMLEDAQPIVRLRAAQGLIAAREKAALPTVAGLLTTIPAPLLPRVEELLYRLADDKGPNEAILATSPDSRALAAKAWGKWLSDNQAKIDLTNLNDREAYLGLITVAEYDNRVGQIQGQVWEGPRGGAKRWNFTGVMGAMDAQTLPNGRVLVAENNANRVTERDSKGTIKWEYRTPNNPIACQRLPNGNTFIASYNMVMEVKPDQTKVYQITPGPQFYIFSAHKARNGHIVAITAQGQILELEAPSGKQVNAVQAQTQGNWCSVEMQPNGNYLVASLSNNMVREIDRKGTEVWSKPFPGVFRATRLPNGNVLVASMNTREVAEMDRAGNIRWRITCEGRPWGIHYR